MRKTQLVVLAFAAVFAFSAFASSSAFALTFEKASFLIGGSDIAKGSSDPIEALGELLFANSLNGAEFTCSGSFKGKAESEGAGAIEKIFNLAGTEVGELGKTGISCTNEKSCTNATAYPEGLPFKIKAEQDEGKFYVLIAGAYEFLCEILGVNLEELCHAVLEEGFIGGEVISGTTDYESQAMTEPKSECNTNSEEGTITNIAGNLTSSSAGSLAVSLP
jgi:hypothetical protein